MAPSTYTTLLSLGRAVDIELRPSEILESPRSVATTSIWPERRGGLAGDLLHDRHGVLADERDRHWMGAHDVACHSGRSGRRWGVRRLIAMAL